MGDMPDITIRDVPDDVLAALKAKASRSGRSLQAYVRDLLDQDAASVDLADIIEQGWERR
jgi:antitoxin FitA